MGLAFFPNRKFIIKIKGSIPNNAFSITNFLIRFQYDLIIKIRGKKGIIPVPKSKERHKLH